MNRRLAWGIGGILGAGALILGLYFYFAVVRPTSSVMDDLDRIAGLRSMNDGVWNHDAFLPPLDGNLTEDQLARFLRVQAAMRVGLGDLYPTLDERAERIRGLTALPGEERRSKHLGIREAILSFQGLGPVLERAKEIQVNALNTEQFSVAEYRWVRESVYRAFGFSRNAVYLEDFAADTKDLKKWELGDPGDPHAPIPPTDHNREVVASHSDAVGEWLPFLVFGL